MLRVVKFSKDKNVSVEQTVFRSALEKDCWNFILSRMNIDGRELVIVNKIGEILTKGDFKNA